MGRRVRSRALVVGNAPCPRLYAGPWKHETGDVGFRGVGFGSRMPIM